MTGIDEEYQAIDRLQRWRESGGWKLSLVWVVGYNPQRLLTDQRGELVKLASRSNLGEPYEPVVVDPPYHMEGTISQMQDRLRRAMTVAPEFKVETSRFECSVSIAAEQARAFEKRLRRHREDLQRWADQLLLKSLYHHAWTGPPFGGRESRIGKLLNSRDRRQRKRGVRLFNKWWYSHRGLNLQYRKD